MERETFAVGIRHDGPGGVQGAGEEGLAEVVEQETLDGTLYGTGTEVGVVALLGKQGDGIWTDIQGDVALGKAALDDV